jgi:hypothetical protein
MEDQTKDLKAEYQEKLTELVRKINETYHVYGFVPHLYDVADIIKAPEGIDFNTDWMYEFLIMNDEMRRHSLFELRDLSFDYAYFATWPSQLLNRMLQLNLDSSADKRLRDVLKARGNILEWCDAVVDGQRVASVAKAGSVEIMATMFSYRITVGANQFELVHKQLDTVNLQRAKQAAQIYFVELMKWRDYSTMMQAVAG